MKIARIDVFQLDIPLVRPSKYPNKTYTAFDDTVVRLETDTGLVGWGEVCPIGSGYQPDHALGVRAAIEEIAPGLIGEDPTQTDVINDRMNDWFMGGPYAKSALDIACWDITGKAYQKPVYHLIGGRRQSRARAYADISVGTVEDVVTQLDHYRKDGYTCFQIKVAKGSDIDLDIARIKKAGEMLRPGERLTADANKSWKTHEALRVLKATESVDYYIEQPCLTYEECLSIRRQVRQPMLLDESMTDIKVLLRALSDNLIEGIGCKITRVGGITGIRLIRDVCTAAGKFMSVDDAWGADLSVAAQAHVAVTVPEKTFSASYVSTYFSDLRYDLEAPSVVDGYLNASEKPGLGVEPDIAVLGDPVRTYT